MNVQNPSSKVHITHSEWNLYLTALRVDLTQHEDRHKKRLYLIPTIQQVHHRCTHRLGFKQQGSYQLQSKKATFI